MRGTKNAMESICLRWVLAMFLVAVGACSVASAAAVSKEQFAEKLHLYASIKRLEVSFTQVKILKELDVRLASEGRFILNRPEKVIWEISKPSPVRVTIDRSAMRIESGSGDAAHTQVFKLGSTVSDESTKNLTALIAWLNFDAETLYAQYVITSVGKDVFRFDPRESINSPFQHLVMQLSVEGHLKHLSIHEASGDVLEIDFGKPKISRVK